MDPVELPVVYTRVQVATAGMTRAQLRDDGARATRGAYVSRAVAFSLPNVCAAVAEVLPPGAAFSHGTAAGLLGAPVRHAFPLHVSVPPGVARPQRLRIRSHVRRLDEDDVDRAFGLPVTSGAQTWLDLAPVLPRGELVAVGDALYRGGHLDAARVDARLRRAGGVRGVVAARHLAPLLTPLAASRPESLVRYAVVSAGLPAPEVQHPIVDRWGREVAHADLGWARWKIALEYEGRQHAEREQFGRDVDRYSLMAADGWLVLRFAGRHLGRLDAVVERAARALRSRGATW
ncbi:DUF559 domain-containing protein [Blastococcus sp. TML/M2B]|uniref:endonuclease domain-containing protein n=1 Tax=unclassified Blastococcus TaxID=2619396 RepID=UPI00190BBD55|nr:MULTISPECIES: DUF559 domain-containing protein [unclassified Blastococcus]MBN1092513.1 DUF559 domain-containing protein [Blastococcus sp. TML/M2B]MBN1097394.1 DUF559 domain-containing protein [Blastococcus sp. TML/C7B]